MPKQDLEKLVQAADQMDPKDQEVIVALAKKYGISTEYGKKEAETPKEAKSAAPAEAPAGMPAQPAEQGKPDLGQAQVVEAEEAPEPALPEGSVPPPTAPEQAAVNMPPAAAQPATPELMQPSPNDEVKAMLGGLTQELASIRTEIESLKSALEGVAVREPVSEEEAEQAEAQNQDVGQKVKGSPANVPEKSVATDLIKKLGGFSRG
jgi:hypothetical protein